MDERNRGMPDIMLVAIVAYIGIFCSIPIFRGKFFWHDEHILFWILVLEYIVMIPVSIKAFMTLMKNTSALLSFCVGAFATSLILLFVFLFMIGGMSGGLGIMVFLLFPLVDAALAVIGAICGLAYIVKKVWSVWRFIYRSHTNTPDEK
jgi:hypothetical protein